MDGRSAEAASLGSPPLGLLAQNLLICDSLMFWRAGLTERYLRRSGHAIKYLAALSSYPILLPSGQ